MSKVKLLIADQDEIYTDKISTYILEKNNFFEAISINQSEILERYLSKNTVDIILCEPEFITGEIKALVGDALVLLFGDLDQGEKTVNKYQKTDALLSDITFKYAEKIGDKSIIKKSADAARILSVYSPAGGAGKTTLAVAIAAALSQNGYKTIYLNLEKLNSAGKYFAYDETMGISKILLNLKAKSDHFSFEIMKYLQVDQKSGICYFAPPESAMEFNELTNEEYARLLEELANIKDIDYIIIDHASDLSEILINILKHSHKILLPFVHTGTGIEKLKSLLREFNLFPDCKLLMNQFVFILNKSDSEETYKALQALNISGEIGAVIPEISQIREECLPERLGSYMSRYISGLLQTL